MAETSCASNNSKRKLENIETSNHPNKRSHHKHRVPSRRRPRAAATPHTTPQVLLCVICQKESPAYKCPKCRKPYCCIACCRQHKTECSGGSSQENNHLSSSPPQQSKYVEQPTVNLPSISQAIAERRQRQGNDDNYEDIDDEWKITTEMKELMQNSEWLHQELADTGLRQLILDVYAAPSFAVHSVEATTEQEQKLQQLKRDYPRFQQFLDKLLVQVGVLQRQGADADKELGEWLVESGETHLEHPLLLKPIAGRPSRLGKLRDADEPSEPSSSSDEESSEGSSSCDEDSSTGEEDEDTSVATSL